MTEFALVLPILALLLFGVIQFGIVFNNYITLTDATRAGARKAAVSRRASDPRGTCIAPFESRFPHEAAHPQPGAVCDGRR